MGGKQKSELAKKGFVAHAKCNFSMAKWTIVTWC
jgi:hypothetical protein